MLKNTFLFSTLFLLASCSVTHLDNVQLVNDPRKLYELSIDAMKLGRYGIAVTALEKLENQYPFNNFSDKVKLNLAYARYKSRKPNLAIITLNQYLAEKPFGIETPYAWYLRGLCHQEWGSGYFTDQLSNNQRSQFDLSSLHKAYDNFSKVVTDYPNSIYSLDSAYRMKIIKEQLAQSEVTIGKYYYRRGAYLAAINRGYFNLTRYHGSKTNLGALLLIRDSFRSLGKKKEANDIQRIINLNFPDKNV